MSGSVVITKNGSSVFINDTNNFLSNVVRIIRVREGSIENVEDTLTNLFNINYIVLDSIKSEGTNIVLLTTRSGIEGWLVKDDNITVFNILVISKDFNNLSFKIVLLLVFIEEIDSFLDVSSLVKNLLRRFSELHLSQFHFIVEVIGLGETSNFSNGIRRHTPRFNSNDPISKSKRLLLVEDIENLLLLSLISAFPLVKFDLDNLTERLVFREFTVELF